MKIRVGGGTSVSIDGRTFTGRNISINGDKVIVDGVEQTGTLVGPVNVTVNGNAEHVETASGFVNIQGGAGRITTASGDVACGPVSGSVETMSGDVTCGSIAGSVKTMSGDIKGTARR